MGPEMVYQGASRHDKSKNDSTVGNIIDYRYSNSHTYKYKNATVS